MQCNMKCSKCNANRSKKTGTITKESIIAGYVTIPNITYLKCTNPDCCIVVYPPGESQKIFDYLKNKEQELISSQPFSDFIDVSEACEILQISKQAFSKNKRIKRGFILSQVKGEKRYYLKESVIRFKKSRNRDGRYALKDSSTIVQNTNIVFSPIFNIVFNGTATNKKLKAGKNFTISGVTYYGY